MFKQINITSLIISSHLIVIINSQFKPKFMKLVKVMPIVSDISCSNVKLCTDMDSAELVVANSTYEANIRQLLNNPLTLSQNLSTTSKLGVAEHFAF
jgi:hypothetical protein